MLIIVFMLGVVMLGGGILGFAFPAKMQAMLAKVTYTGSLRYFAAVLRFSIGALFLLVAEETGFPRTMQVLGGLSILSGAVVLFLDKSILQRALDWMAHWPTGAIRGICVVALALGIFLVVAAG